MKEHWIMLLMAGLGTLGYSILFYVKPRRLPLAVLGGILAFAAYDLVRETAGGYLIPNFVGAFVGAGYAEILSRITKAPVPIYMIPSIIPLVPGSALYETMFRFVGGAYDEAASFGMITLRVAVGVAGGIMTASVLALVLGSYLPRRKRKPTGQPPHF